MKLSEALIKYIAWGKFANKTRSMKTYEGHLRGMILFMHNCQAEEVTIDHIVEYMEMMRELGIEDRTFATKCSSYKQFFFFLKKQGYKVLDHDLIPIPDFEHKFPKMIDEVDYQKLISACGYRNFGDVRLRLTLGFFWDTGVRLNELVSLDVKDVDIENMRMMVKTEKSRGVKPIRMVFWSKETNKILKEYIRIRAAVIEKAGQEDPGALFINGHSRWEPGTRISDSTVAQTITALSIKANLGYNANPHRFRHRYGRNLALQGANNSIISDMMGHSNINSTRIYTVMNEEMMQEMYRKYNK